MTAEEWRVIPDFPDYEASNQGRIRSWRGIGRYPKRRSEPVILAGHAGEKGYRVVAISPRGTTRYVHRLVMSAFVGPLPEGLETRHLDGDKLNNRLGNLAYGTRTENAQDKLAHGGNFNANRTHCPRGHSYDDANTYRYGGRRTCRRCRSAYMRKRRAQRRLEAIA